MVIKNHGGNCNKIEYEILFPFGLLCQPFIDWAKKCSTMGSSPVRLLVHKEKGLFISFRGALGINEYIQSPNNSKDICTPCGKPCLTACPVSALIKTAMMLFDVRKM